MAQVPAHIAIIMDGNRRWAVAQGLPKLKGHSEGARNLKAVVRACHARGIKVVTLYALSTENLRRSEVELAHLFKLFDRISEYAEELAADGVRFRMIGNREKLPAATRERLEAAERLTANLDTMTVNLAVAYGGRDELLRAARRFAAQGGSSEGDFDACLDTAGCPPVDLLVRTGGHQRLSNFLLWQAAYAELYFTDTLWPDFKDAQLDAALAFFADQQRNLGA
jgi:undecaprenyl diphosphate synthase